MRNNRFRSAYHLCEKVLEAFTKGEILNGHIVVDILDCFLHTIDETEAPEAVANLMWVIFLWWTQINEYYGSNVPLFRRNGYRQSGTMIP